MNEEAGRRELLYLAVFVKQIVAQSITKTLPQTAYFRIISVWSLGKEIRPPRSRAWESLMIKKLVTCHDTFG